jgi:hypothetical protein
MGPITIMSYEGTITRITGSKTTKVAWITDKSRLFFDAISNIKKSMNKGEIKGLWNNYFRNFQRYLYYRDFVSSRFFRSKFLFFIVNNIANETLNIIILLNNAFSFLKIRKLEESKLDNVDLESNFQINQCNNDSFLFKSNFCLLIGSYIRYEGPSFNLKLRQRSLRSQFKLLSLGCFMDLTIPSMSLGSNTDTLKSLFEGKNLLCLDLVQSKNPFIVCSNELFKRHDNKALIWGFNYLNKFLTKNYISLNVLNSSINDVGLNTVFKFLPLNSSDLNNSEGLYFINSNVPAVCNTKKLVEIKMLKFFNSTPSFLAQNISYQGNSSVRLDSITNKLSTEYSHLPVQLFFESNDTFIDTEGFVKRTTRIVTPQLNSKNSWQLLRKLLINFDKFLFTNNTRNNNSIVFNSNSLLNFKNYINFNHYAVCTLTSLNIYLSVQNQPIKKIRNFFFKQSSSKLFTSKIKHWLDDFFCGGKDGFTNHSSVLANCSDLMRVKITNFH